MKILGIEFESSTMNYVLIELVADGSTPVMQSNKLKIGDTRSREAVAAFQSALEAIFNSTAPDLIGIKAKPENGQMRAGAASLKMEAIVLANSPCSIDFVSGARINKCEVADDALFAYLQPALKSAHAALAKKVR